MYDHISCFQQMIKMRRLAILLILTLFCMSSIRRRLAIVLGLKVAQNENLFVTEDQIGLLDDAMNRIGLPRTSVALDMLCYRSMVAFAMLHCLFSSPFFRFLFPLSFVLMSHYFLLFRGQSFSLVLRLPCFLSGSMSIPSSLLFCPTLEVRPQGIIRDILSNGKSAKESESTSRRPEKGFQAL